MGSPGAFTSIEATASIHAGGREGQIQFAPKRPQRTRTSWTNRHRACLGYQSVIEGK
jgi:hypothetical protein